MSANDPLDSLLRKLITEDPEQVLLIQLRSADSELREMAALQGYSLSLRLRAIKLLNEDSSNTLQRIAESNPDSEEAQTAQDRLKQFHSPLYKVKTLLAGFIK